ncbi:PLP-dependent aminotransferase family protein [Flindersiella endophytica]
MAYFGAARLTRLLDDWADRPGGMSTRLAETIRQLVRTGALPAGARLPSERELAAALGVARTTIGQAFDVLRGDGVLVSRTGAGTFVSASAGHATARGDDRLRSFAQAHAASRIDLRSAALPGVPLVAEELSRLSGGDFTELLDSHGYVPGGLPALRSAIAGYYADQGLPTDASQILVTSGAQQATRLLAEALLEPGRTVIVEEPTFRGAIEVLRAAGASLVCVPSGVSGVEVPAFEAAVRRHRPVLALLQTSVHNPTGSVLPPGARSAVAAISGTYDLPVIDDAAPADCLVDGTLPPPLATYGGQVLTIGSASKGFWGGLRVGWVRADAELVDQLTIVKGAEDLGTSLPAQVVTTRLLARTDEARAYRRTSLGAVRELVLAKLAAGLPEWRPLVPAGGASLWVELPSGCSATAFAERAGRAGVDVLAGPTFSCRDELDGYLRVAFAAPLEEVAAGVDRLVDVWRAWAAP